MPDSMSARAPLVSPRPRAPRIAGLVPLGLLAAWSALVDTGWLRHRALAGPLAVARVAAWDLRHGSLLGDIAVTFARAGAGVVIGAALGAAIGGGIGLRPRLRQRVEPALDFLRAIPPLLIFSLLLSMLGYGEAARVTVAGFVAALAVSLHVAPALGDVHVERLRTLRALGASRLQLLRFLYAYELLPAAITGLRHAFSAALIVTVVAEMLVGAPYGLGTRAVSAQIAYDAPRLYAVTLIAGLLGHAVARSTLRLERHIRELLAP